MCAEAAANGCMLLDIVTLCVHSGCAPLVGVPKEGTLRAEDPSVLLGRPMA